MVLRGINRIMNDGLISDTVLNFSSSLVKHVNGPLFILVLLIIFLPRIYYSFIIRISCTGDANICTTDTVGIPRFVIVTAYQFGQYAMLF